MENLLKKKIAAGEKTLGTFFESGSTTCAELLALGGFDYIIIDTEHGPFEPESVGEFACAAKRRGMTPLVRAKDSSRAAILKTLDVGGMGIIIPNVRSVEEAEQIVRYGKYFPVGERGVAFARGCGFGFEKEQTMQEYFDECNAETMLIPQCETIGCLENIETVVGLPGIDGIFVGPYDLSTAMGIPGQFEDPDFTKALERILRACKAAKKPVFIYASDNARMNRFFSMGFDSVAHTMDTIILGNAVKAIVAAAER